jgi:putative thioredoxin
VDAEQQIAAMLRVQSLPTVLAVVGGRPVPLFQGALPEAQVRQVLDELLALAAENGINGRLDVADGAPGEPEEPALPPLHQQAYDALENGDLAAAAEAYSAALKQNPADAMATAGLAQVSLLQRTESAPADAVARADADPDDIDLGMVAADVEVVTGRVEEGFHRLVALVRVSVGDDRDRVRARLVELFEVVGGTDERVARARRALASALF